MSGAELVTLGCRLNLAESERIGAMLGGEDVVVVNTCGVTAEAMRQSRRTLRRARQRRPDARLIATGCASEIDRAGFAALADAVVPNAAKLNRAAWDALFPARSRDGLRVGSSHEPLSREQSHPQPVPQAGGEQRHTRAFVPVQTGCDHACTFCVIPQGRGSSVSRTAGEVVAEVRALSEAGVAEVILTGVDLTAWQGAASEGLGALVAAILQGCPCLPRLRLSSLDGVEIDDALFDLLTQEPRVMPHVHLSLQSGDDLMLKRMRRRHSRSQAIQLIERLRAARPDIAIGADLIAGFPTEDEAMHANTVAAVAECGIVHGHVFPFSPRPGTPAARMPQVAPARVRERAAELREAVAKQRAGWLVGLVGSRQQVLAERDGTGHAPNFARFRLPAATPPGALVRCRAEAVEGGMLTGIAA